MNDLSDLVLAFGEPDPALLELIEQISQRLQAGERVDTTDFVRRHPKWAGAIRRLLPTMHDLAEHGRAVDRDRRRGQQQVNSNNANNHKP